MQRTPAVKTGMQNVRFNNMLTEMYRHPQLHRRANRCIVKEKFVHVSCHAQPDPAPLLQWSHFAATAKH